jgi:hypothetical protein
MAGTTVGARSLRPGRTRRGLGRLRGGRGGVVVLVGKRMEGARMTGSGRRLCRSSGTRGGIHGED